MTIDEKAPFEAKCRAEQEQDQEVGQEVEANRDHRSGIDGNVRAIRR